jgi:translation initiation factor IF-2
MDSKVKIREIADEVGISNKEMLEIAKKLGYDVKAATSTVSEEDALKLVDYVMSGGRKLQKEDSKKKSVQKSEKEPTLKRKKSTKEKETSQKAKEEEQKVKEEAKKQIKQQNLSTKKSEKEEPKRQQRQRKGIITKAKSSSAEIKTTTQVKRPLRRKVTIVKKAKASTQQETLPKEIVQIKEENKTISTPKTTIPKDNISKEKVEQKTPTPPKKKKKKTPPSTKGTGERIELADRGFGDSVELYEEQEIMLLDFADRNIYEEQQRQDQKRKEEARRRLEAGILQPKNTPRSPAPKRSSKKKKKTQKASSETQKIDKIKIPEDVRVYEFAEKVGKSVGEVIKVLFSLGTVVTKNDFLDKDSIEILAEEFDVQVETINPLDELDYVKAYDEIPNKVEEPRAPIITVMGHVDHGKTSLLDKIRQTKVAAKEAGGITQHVGAYQVEKNGQKITFIDTPGHSAFTQMRARGAQATDIAIIVVAADDGVMPQTKESISHAKAADVPIIIAINKIDKPTANPDNVKSQLAEIGIIPVEWGGEYEFVNVSAHTGEGIDDLLETILLQAEIMELKADPTRNAKAIVIESSLEKGFGAVANVIIKNGSLSVGDSVIVGTTFGRVRTLILDDGSRAKKIGPSTPAAVVGLQEVPQAGEILIAMDNEKEARELAQKRKEYARAKELSKSTKVSIDELGSLIAEGKIKKLPLIIKADVQGSLEAIKAALEKLKNDEVKVEIIHSGIGAISENDVLLADASSNALILGFNVRPTGAVKKKAEELGIEIKTYSIIYDLIDEVEALLSGLMSPVIKEEITGQAEVRETFVVAKVGTIAGCMVTDGVISRNSKARLIRDGVVIYDTKISSLKRFSDDVKEVRAGFECGLMLENFNDIKIGDIIETYKEIEEQAKLSSTTSNS